MISGFRSLRAEERRDDVSDETPRHAELQRIAADYGLDWSEAQLEELHAVADECPLLRVAHAYEQAR